MQTKPTEAFYKCIRMSSSLIGLKLSQMSYTFSNNFNLLFTLAMVNQSMLEGNL